MYRLCFIWDFLLLNFDLYLLYWNILFLLCLRFCVIFLFSSFKIFFGGVFICFGEECLVFMLILFWLDFVFLNKFLFFLGLWEYNSDLICVDYSWNLLVFLLFLIICFFFINFFFGVKLEYCFFVLFLKFFVLFW